jgi:hypothetical protein
LDRFFGWRCISHEDQQTQERGCLGSGRWSTVIVLAIGSRVLESVANLGATYVCGVETELLGSSRVDHCRRPARYGGARPYQQADSADSNIEVPEDVPDDELAPAAVQLDVSNLPPLPQELYQATRETKEQQVLARLAHAKELIEGGADLRATDAKGRTALHWAISVRAITPSRTYWWHTRKSRML